MKPISLKIAGLHSFREEQEIPFEHLGELGVFGIFGPTGSGKSSILDAMTLALYGTVVRAGRRTQGILNHAEKQVKVSFVFSLGQGRERQLYRVERRYVRKGQLAVNNTHSRLIAVRDEQEEVMADKEREVTEQIIGLLGLKEEDFTRAVVLPQGKFADFLNLGGKERREMLQRLFSLEQYGNVLINKVNDRLRAVETSYIEVESEQKGLGDASPAAVAKAQAVLEAARQAEVLAVSVYRQAEAGYNETKEIYNLQTEKNKKQAELIVHRQRDNEVAQMAAALELADRAGRVDVILEEFLSCQNSEQAAATAKQQAIEYAADLAEMSKQLGDAYNAARQLRLKRQPELIEQRTKLEAARQLEEQVAGLTEQLAELAAQQHQQQAIATTAGQMLNKQLTRSQRLADEIKQLEHQLIAASISSAQRVKIQQCVTDAQTLLQKLTIAEKIKQSGIERKQHCDAAQAAAEQAAAWQQQTELQLNKLEAAEAKAAQLQLQAASAQLDQLLAEEKQAAAVRLAGQLVEGSPCPVCGSANHPCPANASGRSGDQGESSHFEQEIAAAKARIATLTQTLAETGQAVAAQRQSVAKAAAAAAALSQQTATAIAELEKVRTEYSAALDDATLARRKLLDALENSGRTGVGADDQAVLNEVRQLAKAMSDQDKLVDSLSAQLTDKRQQSAGCQAELDTWQQQVKTVAADLAAITARVAAAAEHVQARQRELVIITREIPASKLLADIAQALAIIQQQEDVAKEQAEQALTTLAEALDARARAETSWLEATGRRQTLQIRLEAKLKEEGFTDVNDITAARMSPERQQAGRQLLKTYAETEQRLIAQYEQLQETLRGRAVTEADWRQSQEVLIQTETRKNTAVQERVEADKDSRDLAVRHRRWSELETARLALKEQRDCLAALRALLRGNVFVEFLAQEQMELVARQASERLKLITQHRYALELNSDGGFLIRDDANGGVKRPVSTLSGGETFQTSLALSLALSAQIQLKGKYPLEFFFLDEGFGSLDQQALDVAVSTLERLHVEQLTIGIISHVAELKQRMPRRLLVEPAEPAGRGSRVRIEEA